MNMVGGSTRKEKLNGMAENCTSHVGCDGVHLFCSDCDREYCAGQRVPRLAVDPAGNTAEQEPVIGQKLAMFLEEVWRTHGYSIC